MTRTALVTRPREDAAPLAQALIRRGYAVLIEPMLDIVLRGGVALPLDTVQGLLATSANGVRALAANNAPRDLPLWAVGDATARCALALGFRTVESAAGDIDDLAGLVCRRLDPRGGALLHATASKRAGDLARRLTTVGFTVRRVELYEARAASEASPALLRALDEESLDLALFFSPRTASTFATLICAAGRQEAGHRLDAYALSGAVARALAAMPWRRLRVAERPDQESLLAAIDADAAGRDEGGRP
jgi:uroporphyrinogen-III synthase